eukprot:364631-Chlamydomonas_euryale.AAC.26
MSRFADRSVGPTQPGCPGSTMPGSARARQLAKAASAAASSWQRARSGRVMTTVVRAARTPVAAAGRDGGAAAITALAQWHACVGFAECQRARKSALRRVHEADAMVAWVGNARIGRAVPPRPPACAANSRLQINGRAPYPTSTALEAETSMCC